jgi:hypothetical protein
MMDEAGRTAEQRGEKLNLGLSVKERMALFQKQSHTEHPQPKSVLTDVGVAVRDRARTIAAAPPHPAPVRKEPIALPKPSPVETISASAAQTSEMPAPRVSIKDRINMIESATKATSATSPRGPVDFPKPKIDRNPFPSSQPIVSHKPAPAFISSPSPSAEEPKSEPFRPGRVAEMTSKITQSQAKPSSKPIDIGVSIQAKKQLLQQQATKSESERARTDLEGLPSLEARKSLLSSNKPATEPRKDQVFATGASLQDRLSALSKQSGEEETKRQTVEPMAESLAERKARIQQALAAKMGPGAQGGPLAIPVFTAGAPVFAPSASTAEAVAPSEVEKPTIHRTVMRKAADFDDFD